MVNSKKMRNPKFRAWYSLNGKDFSSYKVWKIDFYNSKIVLECISGWIPLENVILEEYTGVRDRNTVDICEGDIIDLNNYLYTVIYSTEHAGFKLKRLDSLNAELLDLEEYKTISMKVVSSIQEEKNRRQEKWEQIII